MTGLTAGGFLSLTAFQAEGCGIALTGDEHKVSVTDSPFRIIWHEKHYVDQPPSVAFPPLVPYGTKGGMPEWYMKYMTLCFSPQIPCFPLRGSPAKRERVYGAEHR